MKSCVDLADEKRLKARTESEGLVTPPVVATIFWASSPSDPAVITGISL